MVVTEMSKYVKQRLSKGRSFKYENVWQTHADYDRIVNDLWGKTEKGTGLSGFANSLSSLQTGLESWGTSTFGNFKRKHQNLPKELDRVRRNSMGGGPSVEEKRLMEKINEVLYQEEIWIKQRARVNWLKSGDRNTAYFHAHAAQRKRINGIHILYREDGSVCETADDIKDTKLLFWFIYL
jgi:hypothetical protein